MAAFLSLAEAVEANVKDGDKVAIEGFTHYTPFAAGRAVIRQKRKPLMFNLHARTKAAHGEAV